MQGPFISTVNWENRQNSAPIWMNATKEGTGGDTVWTPVVSVGGGGGNFNIPSFDSQHFTYFGSTNNIQTQVFKKGGSTVATLTFAYVGSGVADDDLIASITQS